MPSFTSLLLQVFIINILTNTSFLKKLKIKFMQIKQNAMREKCCQKHEKRCKCACTHEA